MVEESSYCGKLSLGLSTSDHLTLWIPRPGNRSDSTNRIRSDVWDVPRSFVYPRRPCLPPISRVAHGPNMTSISATIRALTLVHQLCVTSHATLQIQMALSSVMAIDVQLTDGTSAFVNLISMMIPSSLLRCVQGPFSPLLSSHIVQLCTPGDSLAGTSSSSL